MPSNSQIHIIFWATTYFLGSFLRKLTSVSKSLLNSSKFSLSCWLAHFVRWIKGYGRGAELTVRLMDWETVSLHNNAGKEKHST